MWKAPLSSRLKIAVFISGTGRLLKNFIDCSGKDYEIVCVGADRTAIGLKYVVNSHLPWFVSNNSNDELIKFACRNQVDIICLAGFLSLLKVPSEWEDRILNIHPSLIPKFCGKSMYGSRVHKAVIDSGEKESGCTVHFCDNEYDHGAIILQKKLSIPLNWDAKQLASAVFELEKSAYSEALSILIRTMQ